MDGKEALLRAKTGHFNDGYGFDMQLLVDTMGIIGEMFNSGRICEVVHCRDCQHSCDYTDLCINPAYKCTRNGGYHNGSWFCADGERR